MSPRILYAGLGNMGRGMSKTLVEKGNLSSPLLLWNRSIQRTQEFSASLPAGKTEIVSDLNEGAAKADVIFTCLLNDNAVQSQIESILASVDVKGKLFIDCSTIHPTTSDAIGKAITAKGAEFVAAPVFGAPAMADAGLLVGVLAGPTSSINRALPYFKGVLSRADVLFSGEPYSKSTSLKILGNTFVMNMVTQLAEAHVASEKMGLGNEQLHQVVTELFGGPWAAYSTRMLSGDYWKREEPLFVAEGARKDIRHAKNLIEGAGATVTILDTSDEYLKEATAFQDAKGKKTDIAAIYGAARARAGLEFANPPRE